MKKRYIFLFILTFLVVFPLVGGGMWVYYLTLALPTEEEIVYYHPTQSTLVTDFQGYPVLNFFQQKNRIWVPLSQISIPLQKAVLISEDDTFFEHEGINVEEIKKSFLENWKRKKYFRGGSTITQQLAKNAFLSREKTITRKIKELFLAKKIERVLSKKKIYELYLNEVEWGDGIYGIEAASRYYFDKHAADLDLAESSMLAGMLVNPIRFNPYENPDPVKKKQKRVLELMSLYKILTPAQIDSIVFQPFHLRDRSQIPQFVVQTLKEKSFRRPGGYRGVLQDLVLNFYGEDALYSNPRMIRLTLDHMTQHKLLLATDSLHSNSDGRWIAVLREDTLKAINTWTQNDSLSQVYLPKVQKAIPDSSLTVELLSKKELKSLTIIVKKK